MRGRDVTFVTVTHRAASKRRFRVISEDDVAGALTDATFIYTGVMGEATIRVFFKVDGDVIEIEERKPWRPVVRRFAFIDAWLVERFGTSTGMSASAPAKPQAC